MTNNMYLNTFANTNPSFIEISTRVLPDNLIGSWTREPDPASEAAPTSAPTPSQDAWRKGELEDVAATAAMFLTMLAGAVAVVVF